MSYTLTMQNRIPTYNQNDLQSLAYGKAVAAKLRQDPALLQHARDNIQRWKAIGNDSSPHQEWLDLIEKGLEKVLEVLESETEEGQRLRSSNPFPGLLTQEERGQIANECKSVL